MRVLLALVVLLASGSVEARPHGGGGGSHSSRSSSSSHSSWHRSTKSHAPGSDDGRYQGGQGSSHKGGHYKNEKTADHYRDRKGASR